jgi:hypothetical protein
MVDENICVAMVYQVSFRKLLSFFTTYVKNIACTQTIAIDAIKTNEIPF